MKRKKFACTLATILTFSLSFQPSAAYAADFTSGPANISETAGEDFTNGNPENPDGYTAEQGLEFGDGTGEILEFDDSAAEAIPVDEEASVPGVSAGDTIADASNLTFGQNYSGSVSTSSDADFYRITLNSSGHINITSVSRIPGVYYRFYDSTGERMWNTYYSANSSGQRSVTKEFDLTRGTYYLGIELDGNKKSGTYSLQVSFTDAKESFAETGTGNNNSIAEADSVSIGTTYRGQIAHNDEKDFYGFSIGSSGRLSLSSTAAIDGVYYRIYDSTGERLWNEHHSMDSSGQISLSETWDLTKGTYYLGVERSGSNNVGTYSFRLGFTSAGESFTETGNGTDNTVSVANSISLGAGYKGQIAYNDEKDFYKFTVADAGKYTVASTASIKSLYYRIYDSTGKRMWNQYESADSSGNITLNEILELERGTYYLGVERNSSSHTGNYSFTISPASVIPSTANGLIIYEGEWVFVANGIIQSQHTGLALYDGECFYITNGKLDTTINRLVSYDGGLFVVAAGRLVREVNGLWQNPADDIWYFVSNGQVQSQHTGVAMYDGEFFYIRNGKLASDYNGTIRYDGATFKVVAGQLY